MKTGIIVAMQRELESCRRAGFGAVTLSGIGKVNAARAATELILSGKVDCIINSGCAGSLCAGVRVGDLVVAERCAWHDVWCGEPNEPGTVEGCPRYFEADPLLLEAASRLCLDAEPFPGSTHCGLVCSGDQFFISMEEDMRIRSLYPEVLACDMESAAVAQVCRHYGVPFLSFRIISDEHLSAEGQKESYEGFWSDISDTSFDFLKRLVDSL